VGSNPTPRTIDVIRLSLVTEHSLFLLREGYRESTIWSRVSSLKSLARKADLKDPEAVKAAISQLNCSEGRKEILVTTCRLFCSQFEIPFTRPRYQRVETLPFIPLEVEVDQLIAGMGKRHATYLQFLKETGARAGEAWNAKWTDINIDSVAIRPEKSSRPRMLKLSNALLSMINRLPRGSEFVFGGGDLEYFSRWFYVKRKEIAEKLGNPRIRQIGFKTLRHWKATNLYHRTRDILLVQRVLGHKDIRNTLVYTHLIDTSNDDCVCKTAGSVEDAKELIEEGFEYVTEYAGVKLFRKRK